MSRMVIKKTYSMECAHFLPLVEEGHKCKNMHGHSYQLSFEVSTDSKALIDGMVCDFANISLVVKSVITMVLDHKVLNDITGLENPTAENIALYCADLFCHEFRMNFYRPDHPYYRDRKDQKLQLDAVEVRETDNSFVRLELNRFL